MLSHIQPAFSGGEISPSLYGRVNLQLYREGLRTLLNMIAHAEGGASNRPGTYYVENALENDYASYLIPFKYSVTQAYGIELNNYQMRPLKDGGVIDSTNLVASFTEADPGVITCKNALVWPDNSIVEISTATGLTAIGFGPTSKRYRIYNVNTGAKTFELYELDGENETPSAGVDTTPWDTGTYVADSSTVTWVGCWIPYSHDELSDLKYTQSADVMYLTHKSHWPRTLSRTDHHSWTIPEFSCTEGPWQRPTTFSYNPQRKTFTFSTEYASNVTVTSPVDVFHSSMIGRNLAVGYFDVESPTNIQWKVGVISAVPTAKTATVDFTANRGPLGFDYSLNHGFSLGLAYWRDASLLTGIVALTDDFQMQMTIDGVGDIPYVTTEITVPDNTDMKVVIEVDSASSSGTRNLQYGIGSDATTNPPAVLGWQTYAPPTGGGITISSEFNTGTPTDGKLYIHVRLPDNATLAGSGDDTDMVINNISVIRAKSESNQWRVPAWYTETPDGETIGYPQAVAFHEQRLMFASIPFDPQTFWASVTAEFDNFGNNTPTLADDSITFTLYSQDVNDVKWLISFKELLGGTSAAEWRIGKSGDSFTQTTVEAEPHHHSGASAVTPLVIDNSVVFLQRGETRVMDFIYSREEGGFVADDVSLQSSHFFEEYQITDWAYARLPYSIIWGIRSDGDLLGLTYLKNEKVKAWHRHETDGYFESVTTVPGTTADDVYFCVKRYINGSWVRFIERFEPRITDKDTFDYFFVDAGLSRNVPKTITGITEAEPAVVTSGSHGFSDDTIVRLAKIEGMTELNNDYYRAVATTTDTFELINQNRATAVAVTAITKANPGVVTVEAGGLDSISDGDYVYIDNVGGMTEVNGNYYQVAGKSGVTFELNTLAGVDVDTSGYTAYTSGGGVEGCTKIDSSAYTTYIQNGEARECSTTFSGLDHLEGESISVLADGHVSTKTVSSGAITLDNAAGLVHAGLGFTSDLETLDIEPSDIQGTAQGKIKIVPKARIKFKDSRGAQVGQGEEDQDDIAWENKVIGDAPLGDEPQALHTTDVDVDIDATHDYAGRIIIRNEDPIPITVLAIMPEIRVQP